MDTKERHVRVWNGVHVCFDEPGFVGFQQQVLTPHRDDLWVSFAARHARQLVCVQPTATNHVLALHGGGLAGDILRGGVVGCRVRGCGVNTQAHV